MHSSYLGYQCQIVIKNRVCGSNHPWQQPCPKSFEMQMRNPRYATDCTVLQEFRQVDKWGWTEHQSNRRLSQLLMSINLASTDIKWADCLVIFKVHWQKAKNLETCKDSLGAILNSAKTFFEIPDGKNARSESLGRLAHSRIDDGEVRGGGETGLRAHNRPHTREGIRHDQSL